MLKLLCAYDINTREISSSILRGDNMPRGDRIGPSRRGSKTGRGLGYCTGYRSPGFTKGRPRGGGGIGRGVGRGFGYRSRPATPGLATSTPEGNRVSRQSRPVGQTQSRQVDPGTSGSSRTNPTTENLKRKAERLEKELEEIYREMDKLNQNT